MEIPSPLNKPKVNVVKGFNFAPAFKTEVILSGLNYEAKANDVFIVTFPKCGTTWTQQICTLLFADGELPAEVVKDGLYTRSPFLESMGAKAAEDRPLPGTIKTHLPFHLIPYNQNAKYLYVMRNPKDACVSFYYHTSMFREYEFEGSFHDFMLSWLRGEVECGSFKDHVLSWWKHRNDSNVMLILYEDMRKDVRSSIMRIAEFIGSDLKSKLEKSPEIVDKIVEKSDISFMKDVTNKAFERRSRRNGSVRDGIEYKFIRKGIVGDWSSHFTDEENRLFEQWFRTSFAGTGVESLWDEFKIFDYRNT